MRASEIAEVSASAEPDRRGLAPFTDTHPDPDDQTAYAARWAGVQAKLDAGQ
jgi:hypothetical protein